MWSKIIYSTDNQFIQKTDTDPEKDFESFTIPIAEGLYTDLQQLSKVIQPEDNLSEDFIFLSEEEKSFWYNYASEIPDKFHKLNLFIQPFEGFCRTCIITDSEIEALAQMDLGRNCMDYNHFTLELNYLIPLQLKKRGYEIIRPEEAAEINIPMIRKLARAIHSKYLHELRSKHTRVENDPLNSFFYSAGDFHNQYIADFDDLPDEIKYSNIDNAAHIPTKLLSIGYKIRPVKKGFKPITLRLSEDEIETMAVVEHMRWSWDKRLNGWIYGDVKDELKRTHPGLIPYDHLPESEKDKDRQLVRLIPSLLKDIDYEAFPVDARLIRHLSYALKPQSVIHKILNETRAMNDQIRKLVDLTPSIEEMVKIRNNKIEEAIREIEGSYQYAQHIQETFLPDDLYVRECFPESFILFKPKDIVSGDFYFFSRQEHLIIFSVVDCTGHGIPGALLSTIGYGTLDQAVNEIKLTDPSFILSHLYTKMHRFLRNDAEESGLSDDMDIILCVLDIRTNILTYTGVKNPLYHIKNGEVLEYRAKNSPEICKSGIENLVESERIQLNAGDTIYLCSDGYIDQFGGKNHRKFLGARLKSTLHSISEYAMPEQSDMLFEVLEQWRDENHEDQTDDILVIGIKV